MKIKGRKQAIEKVLDVFYLADNIRAYQLTKLRKELETFEKFIRKDILEKVTESISYHQKKCNANKEECLEAIKQEVKCQ